MKTNSYSDLKETKSCFLSLSLPKEKKLGNVHSVFKTSFNVSIEGKLFNFSRTGMSLSAHGCIISQEKMSELLTACRPDDLVRVDKGVFTIYTSTGVYKIDTGKMKELDLSIPVLTHTHKLVSQTPMYKVLQSLSFHEHIGLEKSKEVEEAFNVLQTLPEQSEEKIKKIVSMLIGRGKGLTPSGDDILSGYLMIRKALIDTDSFEEILREQLTLRTTTDISLAYYDALFSGYVSSLFIKLIQSIEKGSETEAEQLVQRISLYGHTSGYDTLFGVYLGLQSILNEKEPEE